MKIDVLAFTALLGFASLAISQNSELFLYPAPVPSEVIFCPQPQQSDAATTSTLSSGCGKKDKLRLSANFLEGSTVNISSPSETSETNYAHWPKKWPQGNQENQKLNVSIETLIRTITNISSQAF